VMEEATATAANVGAERYRRYRQSRQVPARRGGPAPAGQWGVRVRAETAVEPLEAAAGARAEGPKPLAAREVGVGAVWEVISPQG